MEIRVRASVDRNSRGYTVSGTVEMQDEIDLTTVVHNLSRVGKTSNMAKMLEGVVISLRKLATNHTEALIRDLEARFPLVVEK